jgi:hypothetical protein
MISAFENHQIPFFEKQSKSKKLLIPIISKTIKNLSFIGMNQ